MSEEQRPEPVEVEEVAIEIDDDGNLTPEQRKALEFLGIEFDEDEETPTATTDERFESLDDLVAREQGEDEGYWIPWDDVPGAEFLLAHPEKHAIVFPRFEREERARAKVPAGEVTPAHVLREATAKAAYKRSIRGWRGVVLKGKELEFNLVNLRYLMRMRRFRRFWTRQCNRFNSNPSELAAEAGKS